MRNLTPLQQLLPHVLGVGQSAVGTTRPRWTVRLQADEARALLLTTGVDVETLRAMTLDRYNGRALVIDDKTLQVERRVLWGRGAGTRFCPRCLEEQHGRWSLVWRLGWSFACTQHRCLLLDLCPACERRQRDRPYVWSGHVAPGHCSAALPGGKAGRGTRRCGFDLTSAEAVQLPPDHESLRVAAALNRLVEDGTVNFGIYADSTQPVRAIFSDVRVLAARVLAHPDADAVAGHVPPELMAALQRLPEHRGYRIGTTSKRARQRPDRHGFMAPPYAASVAVAATAAMQILGRASVQEAGKAARWLIGEDAASRVPSYLSGDASGASPRLSGVLLAAAGPLLQASAQVRFRTASTGPRRPEATREQITRRARALPSLFRIEPALLIRPFREHGCVLRLRELRLALSVMVLLVGSRISMNEATLSNCLNTLRRTILRTQARPSDGYEGAGAWPRQPKACNRFGADLSNTVTHTSQA